MAAAGASGCATIDGTDAAGLGQSADALPIGAGAQT